MKKDTAYINESIKLKVALVRLYRRTKKWNDVHGVDLAPFELGETNRNLELMLETTLRLMGLKQLIK
jgi:hypothetical protein